MSSLVRASLEAPLKVISYSSTGIPETQQAADGNWYFVTTTVNFVPASGIQTLYNGSLASVKNSGSLLAGIQMGGPGRLVVNASSLDLGASSGIVSYGASASHANGGINYASLAP